MIKGKNRTPLSQRISFLTINMRNMNINEQSEYKRRQI